MVEAGSNAWPWHAVFGTFSRNPEKEQAALRVSLGGVVLLAYAVAALIFRSTDTYVTLAASAFYVAFGVVTYIATMVSPARSRLRLIVATFTDQALLVAILALGGRAALPLLWVVFWFLVGAGCRYGRRMLGLSCAVALGGLASLMLWQPWWRANLTAGVGVALSVAGTSFYLAVLVYRLEKQAGTDPLTGLGNRTVLERAIGRSLIARGAETGGSALLLIDLDGFKEVNDSHGHAVGDELLRGFATALAARMRRGDTLARLGGDEFVILARNVYRNEDALTIADGIHSILSNVQTVSGHPVAVSGSIGICMLDNGKGEGSGSDPLDARALMRAADSAMYRAKSRGKGQTAFADAAEALLAA